MVHLHIHLDVRASCNDGLEQIAPLVLSPNSKRELGPGWTSPFMRGGTPSACCPRRRRPPAGRERRSRLGRMRLRGPTTRPAVTPGLVGLAPDLACECCCDLMPPAQHGCSGEAAYDRKRSGIVETGATRLAEAAQRVVLGSGHGSRDSEAIRLHDWEFLRRNGRRIRGGFGYSKEYQVERLHCDAPVLLIGGRTSAIQRRSAARCSSGTRRDFRGAPLGRAPSLLRQPGSAPSAWRSGVY